MSLQISEAKKAVHNSACIMQMSARQKYESNS